MTSIARSRGDIIVGVDTHKDKHVAVVLDCVGGRLADITVPATPVGYSQLIEWASAFGLVVAYGVEGTGSYGAGLASYLRRHGAKVIEVNRPSRKADRRANGKSDTLDAEHAAREVLAGTSTAVPKTADGAIETLRLVKIARDTAVKAHTAAMIALKATLVTGGDDLRAELEHLTNYKLIVACAALAPEDLTSPAGGMRHVLGSLARRWLQLHEEIKVHSRPLKQLTKTTAPALIERSESAPMSPPSCSWPPATIPTGSARSPPTPNSAGHAPSRPRPARPTVTA